MITIQLLDGTGLDIALLIDLEEEILSHMMVDGQRGPGEVIEADADFLEALGDVPMIAIDNLLGANTLFLRPDGDGNTVFIRPTDVDDVLAAMALVSGVDIGGKIAAG